VLSFHSWRAVLIHHVFRILLRSRTPRHQFMHKVNADNQAVLYARTHSKDDWERVGTITVGSLPDSAPAIALPYATVKTGLGETLAVAQAKRKNALASAKEKEKAAHAAVNAVLRWAQTSSLALLGRFDKERYGCEPGRQKLIAELTAIQDTLPTVSDPSTWQRTFALPWPAPWIASLLTVGGAATSAPAGSESAASAAAAVTSAIAVHTRVPHMDAVPCAPLHTPRTSFLNKHFYLYRTNYEPFWCVGKLFPNSDRKLALQPWHYALHSSNKGEGAKVAAERKPSWLKSPLCPTRASAQQFVYVDTCRMGPEVRLDQRNVLTVASAGSLQHKLLEMYPDTHTKRK
jgi:hypothetical protein